MKKLLFVFFVLSLMLSKAFAFVNLPENAVGISNIRHGEIISVKTQPFHTTYPEVPHVMPITKVVVKLSLNGCLDKLGTVSSIERYDDDTQQHVLTVSAINIHTKNSIRVLCAKGPIAFHTFYLPPFLTKDDV